MIATLRQRNFALLWTAGLVSRLGDWALIAALPVFVYERTGSALATGAVWLAYDLSAASVGPVAGVFVDRWDRRRTMTVVSLAQATVVLGLMMSVADGWLWIALPVVAIQSALAQVFGPAENALLPELVDERHLLAANALNALNDNLGRVAGPAVGGVLVALGGLPAVVLVDAASFLIVALLVALVRQPVGSTLGPDPSADEVHDRKSVRKEWMAGLRIVRRSALLRGVFAVAAVAVLADGILTALLVPFVTDVAGGSTAAFGWFLTVRGCAGLVGSAVVGWTGSRFRLATLLGWGLIGVGVGFLVAVTAASLPVLFAVTIATGPAIAAWLTSQQTLVQAGTAAGYRGRVLGTFAGTRSLVYVIGIGVAGALGDATGAPPVLVVGAALYVAAGVLALALLGVRTAPLQVDEKPGGS